MNTETHNIIWNDGVQDIEIEVLYSPLKWCIISHFEIRSIKPERAPLPITSTGFLSHHFPPDSVDFSKISVTDFILDWLDEEAEKPEWKEHLEAFRQHELF